MTKQDFQIQTDKLLIANKPDIMLIDKQRRRVLMDVMILSDGNIRKKEYKKLEN